MAHRTPDIRSTKAWQRVRAAQISRDPVCAICGSTRRLTADHIVPLVRGGEPLDPANLRTLCLSCNSRKGALERPGGAGRPSGFLRADRRSRVTPSLAVCTGSLRVGPGA